MALPFKEFRKRYGIVLLFASIESIIPGDLFEKRKIGFYRVAHAKDFLGGLPKRYTNRLENANIVYGEIEHEMNLGGKSNLSLLGLVVGGGLKKAKKARFKILGVKARVFHPAKAQSPLRILGDLQALRKNKSLWKLINNKWMAYYVWYATDFKIDFSITSGVDLRTEVGDNIDVGGSYIWKGRSSLLITKNDTVPFGITAWRI